MQQQCAKVQLYGGAICKLLLHIMSVGAVSRQLSTNPALKPHGGCPVSAEEKPKELISMLSRPSAQLTGAATSSLHLAQVTHRGVQSLVCHQT